MHKPIPAHTFVRITYTAHLLDEFALEPRRTQERWRGAAQGCPFEADSTGGRHRRGPRPGSRPTLPSSWRPRTSRAPPSSQDCRRVTGRGDRARPRGRCPPFAASIRSSARAA
eukprot:scaffold3055_cov402-Prasinococcus_capsulatus_cf.AAC.11